ncbi:PucR family transcriptional regulator [Salinifilum ghardaiensis]
MPTTLDEVLRHPSVLRGEPALLTGAAHGARAVRWVHSSEVVDIAPLLRGGELLLAGGVVLSGIDPSRQRSYVRELTARGVCALVVETASTGVGLPEALLDECRQQDFPLIQLTRTVPFVEIAESINGLLVNESVQRLRLADSLSDALSAQLTSGADLQQLTDTLAESTGAGVAVRDRAGQVLATAAHPDPELGAEVEQRRAPITVHGVTTAHLDVLSPPGADPAALEAALDRAPQAFGLALLRAQPPTPGARAARALFQHLLDPTARSADLDTLLAKAGLDGTDSFVAVVAAHAEPGVHGTLEQVLQRNGRKALTRIEEHELLALVALEPHHPERSRQCLVDDVRQLGDLAAERSTIGIGPLATGSGELPHAVAEARRCLRLDLAGPGGTGIIDAAAWSLHRLVHQLDADEALHRFVREQLGALLHEPLETRQRLLRTLQIFFDCAANKTRTAQRLHVRRQTLYQRLDKLSACLGRDVTDPEKLADLQVAVRLRNVLSGHEGG